MTQVAIIGAGIIGMTNAVRLLKQGFNVTVFTKDNPFKTNSDAAVATWYVPEKDKPLLQQLCLESLADWQALSKLPESGVQTIPIVYYFKDEQDFNRSIWSNAALCKLLRMTGDVPEECVKSDAFPFRVLAHVPLIDPSIYRAYLFNQFQMLGGKLVQETVHTLTSLAEHYPLIVNCAGWEAKYLARDHLVYPARGQIEIVQLNVAPTTPYSINIRDNDSYLIFRPQSKTYAVGTTYQINETSLKPRPQDKEATLDKIKPFITADILADSTGTWSQVGVRCGRPDVRLENEIIASPSGKKALVVHCYGHGGSGFSSAFASAAHVLKHCLDAAAAKKNSYPPMHSRL